MQFSGIASRVVVHAALAALLLAAACSSRGDRGGGFGSGGDNKNNNNDPDAAVSMCGDGECDEAFGETCGTCSDDCGSCADIVCGDGVCDLANGETCASCDDDCGTLPQCQAGACGDGVIATDEVCDDGNFNSFDGCSAVCQPEPGYKCEGQPSKCGRAPVSKGEIIVTEIMTNPAAVDDAVGEWFEILNTTNDTLNLENVVVSNESSQTFTVWAPILLEPGEYAVLAAEVDSTVNGGAEADFQYVGFNLADAAGSITMKIGTVTLDAVTYGNGTAVPTSGRSIRLDPSALTADANDSWEAWCTGAGATYGAGDYGSPGAENATCPPPPTPLDFSTAPGLTFPDNNKTGVTTELQVSAPGCTILYMDVDVDVSHAWIGDVRITLKNPAGTAVQLHARTGGSADNIIGNYPNTLKLPTGQSLGAYTGTDPNGTWTLQVADEAGGGETNSRVNSWGLHIYCVP